MMAQMAAAGQGYEMCADGRPVKSGLLVGLKDVVLYGEAHVGDVLSVETQRSFQMAGASIVDGRVVRGEDVLAEGTLKVWEQDAPPERPALQDGARDAGRAPDGLPADPRGAVAVQSRIRRGIVESLCAWEDNDEAVSARFLFGADFAGFAGHFPEVPILPAVCMVELARVAVEFATGKLLRLQSISQAKFTRLVFPDDPVDCHAKIERQTNEIDASVRLSSEGEAVARVHLGLREGDA